MTPARTPPRPELLWLLAAGALLLAVAGWAGWAVVTKYRQATSQLAEIEPRHARLAGLLHSQDVLSQAATRLQANLADYVHPAAADPSQLGNTALQRVRELATRHGLRIASSQTSAPRDEDGFERIGLNLRIEGDWPGIAALLSDLAAQRPAIYYASLQMGQQQGNRRRAGQDTLVDEIFVQLDLYVLKERQP